MPRELPPLSKSDIDNIVTPFVLMAARHTGNDRDACWSHSVHSRSLDANITILIGFGEQADALQALMMKGAVRDSVELAERSAVKVFSQDQAESELGSLKQ